MHIRTYNHSHIFLIGMMGTGKSHWCRILADTFSYKAFDLDHLIEQQENKTITEIFELYGEDYFRKIEAEALRTFQCKESFLLATGGGTPCFKENMQWMNENGITIWIDEPVDVLVERAMLQVEHRPAIKGLSKDAVREMFTERLKSRTSFYSQSQYHLQGENINEQQFINIIKQHA